MAHASRLEAMKLRIKSMKKQKKKAKYTRNQMLAEMTEEERKAFFEDEQKPNYANLFNTSLWDYDRRQLAIAKYDLVISYCNAYIKELKKLNNSFAEKKIIEVEKFKKRLER